MDKDDVDKLGVFAMEMLVRWFEFNMPMEMRHKLMNELPEYYNQMIGRKVVCTTVLKE